jgi:hypothetical protein
MESGVDNRKPEITIFQVPEGIGNPKPGKLTIAELLFSVK